MNRAQILLSIVIFNCISTWMHCTDNAIYVRQYPEPDGFTTSAVFMTVALMTPKMHSLIWLDAIAGLS